MADIGIDDQNKNSRVEPMESVEVTGKGPEHRAWRRPGSFGEHPPGTYIFLEGDAVTHLKLGNIPAGKGAFFVLGFVDFTY